MLGATRISRDFLAAQRRQRWRRRYWRTSQQPIYGFIFALCLLLIYEIGVRVATPAGLPPALLAQQTLRQAISWVGIRGGWTAPLIVVVTLTLWLIQAGSPRRARAKVLAAQLLEGAVLALPLLVASRVALAVPAGALHEFGAGIRVLELIGAAIYEEFLFRFGLLGAIRAAGARLFRPGASVNAAAVLGAGLVFMAAHFTPLGMEPWTWSAALFRGAAGLYLGWIFLHRGLAGAMLTHLWFNLLSWGLRGVA